MKYTPEITQKLVDLYERKVPLDEIAVTLEVPVRSVIAKLSSIGVYHKKGYLNKRGEPPVSKAEMIEDLARNLGVGAEVIESLEKCNKSVLKLLIARVIKP